MTTVLETARAILDAARTEVDPSDERFTSGALMTDPLRAANALKLLADARCHSDSSSLLDLLLNQDAERRAAEAEAATAGQTAVVPGVLVTINSNAYAEDLVGALQEALRPSNATSPRSS